MAWIYKFRIGLVTVLAIALIIVAVAFSILRAVLPHATGYVEEVEQVIANQTGLFVSIGSIDADMRWLTPRLKLLDVVAFDEDGKNELIYFDEAIFSLAIIDSIFNLELTLGEVSLVGADIVIERYANINNSGVDGSKDKWVVQGNEISTDGSGGDSSGVSKELIAVMENVDFLLLDSDVHWIDHKNKKPPLDFIGVNVVSKAFLGKHSLGVDAQLPDGYGDAFRFVVEIADLKDINDPVNANWNIYLEGESVNIKNWLASLELEETPEVSGILDGKVWLAYRNRKISSVSGDISVNSFDVSNKFLNRSSRNRWETDHFNANFNVQWLDDGWRLDIADFVLAKNGRIWGETSDITVLNKSNSALRASATYLRLQDIIKIPFVFLEEDMLSEIKGLQSAGVSGDLYNIEVVVPVSEKSKPTAKGVFKDLDFSVPDTAITVNGMDGVFDYRNGEVELELLSESVEVSFGELFRNPLDANLMEGIVSISQENGVWNIRSSDIHMQNDDAETNTRIDVTVENKGSVFIDMQTDFVHVDAASIKKYYPVSIMSNSLLGWLDDSFKDGVIESGSFILHGDISQFPYANYDGVMEATFSSHNLTLHFLDGWPDMEDMTGDFRFYNSSFSFENGTGRTYKGVMRQAKASIPDLESPRLFMQGMITAPANELQQYVWNSGLDEILGAAMRQFEASGDAHLNISLEVPLDEAETVVETKGALRFNKNKLYFPVMEYTLDDLTGELSFVGSDIFGEGIVANFEGSPLKINVLGNKGNLSKRTVFDVSGNLPADGMLKKFSWIPESWVSGSSDWKVLISLPGDRDDYSVKIDMQSELDGIEVITSDALSKRKEVKMPVSVGIQAIDNILQANVDINGVARIFGTRDSDEEIWDYFVDSPLVKGKGKFAEDLTQDVIAQHDLEYIDLFRLFRREGKEKGLSLAPTLFPPVNFKAKKLKWDNWNFSDVHVQTSRYPQGMLFNSLSLQGPSVNIQGQGSWLSSKKNQHETNFKFKVNSDDYGHTLSTMGFTDSLSQGEYVATADLQWRAEPYGFSLGLITGATNFEITDGRVKDVKPGTGGRMLGLFNVFKLHERILSGFGDVYKKGFVFDSVKGDFKFSEGDAKTINTEVSAKAADISVRGRVGLVERDYDLNMQIRPHSDATIVTTGFLAGVPVIGAGVLLLKKIFGGDEALYEHYTVTGSWDNPVVQQLSSKDEAVDVNEGLSEEGGETADANTK